MFDLLNFSEQGWGNALLKGLWMTLQISAGSFAVGLLIGLVVACAKLSAPRPIAMLMRGYTTVFRAVPELLLIARGLCPGYVEGVVMARLTLGVVLWMIRSAGNGTNEPLPSSITQLKVMTLAQVMTSTVV